MKIVVYLETKNGGYAEVIAQFSSEDLYVACLPALEKKAKASGMIVTESIRYEEMVDDSFLEDSYA